MAAIVQFIKDLKITVEPIMFLLAAANSFRQIVIPKLAEDKMKLVYPPPMANMTHDQLKKFYNTKMVEWDNNYQYVNLPIACILGIMYGGFSDHYGRKLPLLIGLNSLIVETALRMLMYSPETNWSLEWIFPTAVIAGLLGDQLLTMSCINAYVTDTFDNKKTLSIRMIIVSIMFSLGSFVSSRTVRAILQHDLLSEIGILGIAEGMYALTFIIGIIILTNVVPKKKHAVPREEQIVATADEESPIVAVDLPEKKTLLQIIYLSFYSIYEAGHIFIIPREGHKRLFLYLCFFANFLDQLVFGEEKGLIGTYTRLAPFEWTSSTYADYKSWRPIVQILGMLVGMLVFKNWLKLKDTMVICFAISSMGACVLMIGLAKATWVIFASLLPGSLHGLLNPLTYSFMSCLVEPDEIGKAYAMSTIAQKLAEMAQTAILQNIYIATLNWYQGFVWILMSAISFVAVLVYAFVHVLAISEDIGA
ncbi:unnamed protein product [Auanema sp. JU1783]|nr:unnamed protein product [Auanema sp. JU1783]